ncbi:MAG: hypothetical protein DME02_25145 [Candidatus Rokuibacteriota bacterium]|nr:MAG: hypothetical protein DME02_25145 [Candidatus Rokubacteria bacterium]
MLQADGDRRQAMIRRQARDAIAVLLAEIDVVGPAVDGETAERGLARRLGERDHDARRPLRIDRQTARDVETVDLAGGVAATPVAEHDEAPGAIEGELNRTPDIGDGDLRREPRRGHDAHARGRKRRRRHRHQRRDCDRMPRGEP